MKLSSSNAVTQLPFLMTSRNLLQLLVSTIGLAALSSEAAIITWGAATNITTDATQVSTTGTVHYTAAGSDLGDANTVDGSSVTVNGVEFFDNETYDNAFVSHRDTISGRTGISSGGGSYHDLLQFADRDSSNVDVPITFTELTIGTTGMVGAATSGNRLTVVNAQINVANPALHPELGGNVFTVDTRPFARTEVESPTNDTTHWKNNGESMWLMGKGMGDGVVGLLGGP